MCTRRKDRNTCGNFSLAKSLMIPRARPFSTNKLKNLCCPFQCSADTVGRDWALDELFCNRADRTTMSGS